MADPERASGAPEPRREADGGGIDHPTPASEESRGNAPPDTAGTDTGEVVHARRTVPGTAGAVAEEESGSAAGETIAGGEERQAPHDRAS